MACSRNWHGDEVVAASARPSEYLRACHPPKGIPSASAGIREKRHGVLLLLASQVECQRQFLILALQQFVYGVGDRVIWYDAVTGGFVTVHRHVIGHERYVGLELGVR